MDCRRRRLDWGAVGLAHPRGEREDAASFRRAPCFSPVPSPFAAAEWTRPGGGRCAAASAPPRRGPAP